MNTKLHSLLAVSTLCLTVAAHAGQDYTKSSKDVSKDVIEKPVYTPRYYLSLSAGGEFDIHATKFISNGGGDVGIPGVISLPIKVQSRDFTAVHDPGVINGNLEAGYKVNDAFTVFAGFTYSHADGQSHGAGRVTDPSGFFGPAGGNYELNLSVNQYQAYTGRAGFKLTMPRYLLDLIHAPRSITPYLSASAGGKYVEESHARATAGNFINTDVALYDDSWVFTSQVTLGYEWAFTPHASLVLESGYGYDTKPERAGQRLAGFNGGNDGGDRLYSTVSLGGKVRF